MSAYAAVVSLMNTLNSIQIHPRVSTFLDQKQIKSLQTTIDLLLDFIESSNNSHGVSERQIAPAAHAAEDVIESYVIKQILAGEASSCPELNLEVVIKDMKSVLEKFGERMNFEHLQPSYSVPTTSSTLPKTAKNVMVGSDDELIQIMDRLTGYQPSLQIIPVVGMGGIGKTTLIINVYENSLIARHFDIRAWVTISQEYSVKNILSELRSCLGEFDREIDLETEDQIGLKLYQSLWGRRYLIVLDDIWGIEAWDRIKCYFPDNDCRSRVVITSRISSVATHLSSSPFVKNFLDEDKSWILFCGKVFLEEICPPELEETGKKIVSECKGLPLSIILIGGLLRNSTRTREYWEYFSRDLNSILMLENDQHCLTILSLSYNHLPVHLKPCFLYMGVFREDEKIQISQIIKLLVAEGFLKSEKSQTLEETAEDYLRDLVDRNLISVDSWKWSGKLKYCKMHDLVREVCLKIGEREKFFHGVRVIDILQGSNARKSFTIFSGGSWEKNWRRLSDVLPSASLEPRFNFEGGPLPFKFRLLRVLAFLEDESLEAIVQQVNMRYLTNEVPFWIPNTEEPPWKLPSSISLLWNLQTFIMHGRVDAPVEIWYMRQLRHLKFSCIILPDPPPSSDDVLLPNLQTLSRVINFNFTEEVCKSIPNIKKLCLWYDIDFVGECKKKLCINMGLLHNLQSLNCFFGKAPKRSDLLRSLVFPSSLKKLSLHNSHLHWGDLNTFGLSLPHLQVLKLNDNAFVGPEWDCVEGAFPRLKSLIIHSGDLVNWTAENSEFFPLLEKLHLTFLKKLVKIPSGIGEINSLGSLNVNNCSVSAAVSSTEILEEQLSFGNEDLKVEVMLVNVEEEECFWKKVGRETFTPKNFTCDHYLKYVG